jgi:hypothetical protein
MASHDFRAGPEKGVQGVGAKRGEEDLELLSSVVTAV